MEGRRRKRAVLGSHIILVPLAPPASAGVVVWYGGDFDGVSGLSNELNTTIVDDKVYEDSTVPAGGWILEALLANNLKSFTVATAEVEIRSGVSAGNGLTLLHSGTAAVTQAATGRSGFGYDEQQVRVGDLALALPAGTYWLSVAPIGTGSGRSFVSTPSCGGSIGLPVPNGNAFFDSGHFGFTFEPTLNVSGEFDFSMGVEVVPEPPSLALFGPGAIAVGFAAVRRRRARR